MKKSKSIVTKLVFNATLIIFIGGLLTAIAISYNSYTQILLEEKNTSILDSARKAEILSSFFSSSGDLAESIAENDDVVNWLENKNKENKEKEIKNLLDKLNFKKRHSAIFIADTNGEVLISNEDLLEGININNRSYFKKSVLGYAGSDVVLDKVEAKKSYFISRPITNENNQIIGVIVLKINPENVNKILSAEVSETQVDMLVDSSGIIACSTDRERIFKSLAPLDEITKRKIEIEKFAEQEIIGLNYYDLNQKIKSGLTETQNLEEGGENNKFFTISAIKKTSFFLVTETDIKHIQAPAIKSALLLFIPTLLTSLVMIIVIFFLIKSLLKPLETLKETTKLIGLGNFELDKKINTGDEIDELENTILKTSLQLKEAYTRVEDKVKQRTEEIEKKNEQAEKTNRAILNIMEDIEKEKNKVVELAQDLKKFKLALDNSSEEILITDKNGVIIYANYGMEKITGYKIKEVLGKKSTDLWRQIEDPKKEKKMWHDLLEKKKSFSGELKNKRKNTEEYITLTTISPVINDKNEVEFLASISYDISREKAIDQAKTEFVSLASHQLRTPLSSVNWYSEMLLANDAGELNDEQRTFIKEIYKGNQRMVDLVNSLLDVSRLELGTFAINPEPLNIADPAKSVINELKPGITEKKLKVNFNLEENLPLVKADPKLLRIIYQNLLSNAVKYTPEQGEIGVDIKKEAKNFLIKVSDNGYGIPENQKDKMFTKLFRADNVKEKDTEGTGLGLYILKSIMETTGGSIYFESEENKGTSFFVKIPLSGMKKKDGSKTLGE